MTTPDAKSPFQNSPPEGKHHVASSDSSASARANAAGDHDGHHRPKPAPESPNAPPRNRTALPASARLLRNVPTLLVIVAMTTLAYLGHHHGWKIPKFSELTGDTKIDVVAWCDDHGVPEAECIACNADLMPKGELYGWCKVHGVHECVLEHPELAQLKEIPVVSRADFQRASQAIALRARAKNNPACKMHLRRIQFPSAAAADKAGIDIGLVDRGRVVESIPVTGQAIYDPTRVARLASRAAGVMWRVEKQVGDCVHAGDVLALVDAAEVGRAKAELLQAITELNLRKRTFERLEALGTVVAGRRILEAETAVAEAEFAVQKVTQQLVTLGMPIRYDELSQTPANELKRKIQFLGLPLQITQQLDPRQTTFNLIPLVSPRDGIIVARDVVAGEVIDTRRMLFTVADTRRMWLVLNVPLEQARHAKIGQKVIFHPDGSPHADAGTLTWTSTEVDAETRTVEARGELPNEDGHLRNETFGAAEIVLREDDDAIVVPSAAVHWEGCCHVAFVRDKDYFTQGSYKVFHTRSVRPGVVTGDVTEVIAGLMPGEVVVTKGSAVLRAELLKGNLGAG